jgi:inorganic pyrophosphatase
MNTNPSRIFDIVIEVPRWGFIKRGASGEITFISPLPCPYNYGAIPEFLGLDDDLLDAVVLGRRRSRGSRLRLRAYAAIGLTDRGRYDDKLICSHAPLSARERALVLNFFHLYALFKRIFNALRGRSGPTCCEGWRDIDGALARARRRQADWRGPSIGY